MVNGFDLVVSKELGCADVRYPRPNDLACIAWTIESFARARGADNYAIYEGELRSIIAAISSQRWFELVEECVELDVSLSLAFPSWNITILGVPPSIDLEEFIGYYLRQL